MKSEGDVWVFAFALPLVGGEGHILACGQFSSQNLVQSRLHISGKEQSQISQHGVAPFNGEFCTYPINKAFETRCFDKLE